MGAASSESDVSPSRRHVTFTTVFSFVDLCHNAVVSPNLRSFPHEDGRLTSYPQPFHISWHTARDSFVVSLVEVAWATNSEEAVNSFSSKLRCSVNLSIWLNGMQWITWQLRVHRRVVSMIFDINQCSFHLKLSSQPLMLQACAERPQVELSRTDTSGKRCSLHT